jgi:hypothetical protein
MGNLQFDCAVVEQHAVAHARRAEHLRYRQRNRRVVRLVAQREYGLFPLVQHQRRVQAPDANLGTRKV